MPWTFKDIYSTGSQRPSSVVVRGEHNSSELYFMAQTGKSSDQSSTIIMCIEHILLKLILQTRGWGWGIKRLRAPLQIRGRRRRKRGRKGGIQEAVAMKIDGREVLCLKIS